MGRTKCGVSSESLTLKGGSKGRGKDRGASHVSQLKTGFDGRIDAPWRRTATSFKIPCTLVHTTSKRTQKAPVKLIVPNEREKARQIFWAKSLEGLCAMVPVNVADKFLPEPGDGRYIPQRLELPSKLEVMAPSMNIEASAATFCTALHDFDIYGTELTGQTATRKQIEENPFESLKFTQPFIPTITEQDITQQERRVLDARKRLQELRKSFIIR